MTFFNLVDHPELSSHVRPQHQSHRVVTARVVCVRVPKDGREPACLWASFSVPVVLKFPLLYWFMLVIACVCLFWLLQNLL